MFRITKHLGSFAAALAVPCLFAVSAEAAVISANFSAASDATEFGSTDWSSTFDPAKTRIEGAEQTGVVSVGNWTNTGQATSTTLSDLIDDSGSVTTADLVLPFTQYHQGRGFKSTPPASVNAELFGAMGGAIFNAGATYTVSVDQIPFSIYDVYVYVAMTDDNGPTQAADFTLTPDGSSGQTVSVALENGSGTFDDATTDGTGNYILYSGLTADSFDLLVDSTAGNASTLAGFQIVEVPEPASLALMGLGGLLIARRRAS